MPRKTADLYVVYLQQSREGKAAPYRNEWCEAPMDGGARVHLPATGRLTERRDWLGRTGRLWTCFGLSASGRAGAPCVALTEPVERYMAHGDSLEIQCSADANLASGDDGFGLGRLIDVGEFTRMYHLMIAALPAVWKVKKAPKA